jgi:hypothetical protein
VPPAHFALLIFEIGSLFLPKQAWTLLLFYTSYCSWEWQVYQKNVQPFPWTWGLINLFFFSWLTWNLQISINHVAGMTGIPPYTALRLFLEVVVKSG